MNHIPTFALFGERATQQDWLHWETIPARSRLHGFHITAHRHENLMQVLLLEEGMAEAQLDGARYQLLPSSMVLVPAMVVHEYRFSHDVDGLVVTLFEADARALGFVFETALVATHGTETLVALLRLLIAETQNPGLRHDLVVRAHLTLLLAALQRATIAAASSADGASRAHLLAQKFRDLVEAQYRSRLPMSDYADRLGISQTHLNRVCRSVLAASAQEIVDRRVVTEARRYLLFSELPIKLISSELGFDDPAYFSRFISRHLKQSPGAVRAQQRLPLRS